MSFGVAIYNGICDDGQKIVKSVMAAYLYADKVRVYDYSNPLWVDEVPFVEMLNENRKVRY